MPIIATTIYHVLEEATLWGGGGRCLLLECYTDFTNCAKFCCSTTWRHKLVYHDLRHGGIESCTVYSLVYTRVLTRIQPGLTASVNAPNLDCNPG